MAVIKLEGTFETLTSGEKARDKLPEILTLRKIYAHHQEANPQMYQ